MLHTFVHIIDLCKSIANWPLFGMLKVYCFTIFCFWN